MIDGRRDPSRVILITGMSGAGRSTVLHTLEDLGYEAVDNLPLSVLAPVVRGHDPDARPLAVGVDIRSRGFSADRLLELVAEIGANGATVPPRLVFVDCDDEALIRRYTETRRRHPLADDRPAADGIALERRLLEPLRERVDRVIDTSMLQPADLRRLVPRLVGGGMELHLTVTVISFSYRLGLPREADLVFDVRFLKNPHYDPILKPFDGRDERVGAYVAGDPDFPRFFEDLTRLLQPLLPRYRDEGKSYLTLAVGCTGGRHRSVYTAERLGAWLQGQGIEAGIIHRDVDREALRGQGGPREAGTRTGP